MLVGGLYLELLLQALHGQRFPAYTALGRVPVLPGMARWIAFDYRQAMFLGAVMMRPGFPLGRVFQTEPDTVDCRVSHIFLPSPL